MNVTTSALTKTAMDTHKCQRSCDIFRVYANDVLISKYAFLCTRNLNLKTSLHVLPLFQAEAANLKHLKGRPDAVDDIRC